MAKNVEFADWDFHIGTLTIPFYEAVRGDFKIQDVEIKYEKAALTQMTYDDKQEAGLLMPFEELQVFRYKMVQAKLKEATEKKRVMSNGQQVGLKNWRLHDEDSQRPILELYFRPSYFFDHAGINMSLDVPELDDGKGGKTTVRNVLGQNPENFDDGMPNSIGVNTSVITSDGYLVLMNRGDKNMQYPNMLGVGAAGFMSREKDCIGFVPNPFLTAKRETFNEGGIEACLENFTLVQVGRPVSGKTGDMHGEICTILETKMTADEILKANKKEKYEGRHFKVPFQPNDIAPYLKKQWVPAHAALTALTVEKKFGKEALENAVNKVA